MTFYILRSINKLIKEKIKRHLSCIYLQVDDPLRNNPSIAQLVERWTVGKYQKHVVDIPRSWFNSGSKEFFHVLHFVFI